MMRTAVIVLVFVWLACVSAADNALLSTVLNSQANINQRVKAVHSLGKNLNDNEVSSLLAFVKAPPAGHILPSFYVLKNDVLNALREQAKAPSQFTATLIDVFHDQQQDNVMRDYAIQHLISWYEQGAKEAPDAKEKIRAILVEALEEKSSIGGTALLGLHRLSIGDSAFDAKAIDRAAVKLAVSTDAVPAARITALQVCAERGLKEVLPTAQSLSQNRSNIPLQLSAIAALGHLGGAEEANLLQKLKITANHDLEPSLEAALKKLRKNRELY